ncbi:MAG: protein translocase subunit SecD [Eubacteriales bacterium]|nr:protein translocase subunit SecD [Eubacteriales bacterium]MDD3074305.1 protein translocase subunit SecD [Eubacteriales bacterium]MDD4079423.1 protein translocase subunit SecD [Eubacteriales bacterium]MDD4769248.1 protein translocase subunit SecD [Eubacteriales bacterium]
MTQWTKLLTLILIMTTIAAAAALSVPVIVREINLGIDLRGGVYVLLEAQTAEDGGEQTPGDGEAVAQEPLGWWQKVTAWFDGLFGGKEGQEAGGISADDMAATVAVLRNRVDSFGLTEPIIQREGERRIRIELATDPTKPEQSQRAILETIGKTALLEFKDASGKTVLTGANLTVAQAVYQTDEFGRQVPMVSLEFDSKGAQIFSELTASHIGQQVPIYLDGEVISAPQVRTAITDGKAVITGIGSIDEAARLANLLRSGALPLEMVQLEVRTVGPTLGSDSLMKSLWAGLIGMGLVIVFMIAFYRLPGLIASFSLLAYIVILLDILVALKAVLTLPGIAGIILTVGMAVDANVIIFERLKEELKNGKTPRASLLAGFDKALSSIMDGNITTLIVAAILYALGTGPIRGFALTLSLGILCSMFTAIVITRLMMNKLVDSNTVKRNWLLGVNR